MNQAGIGQRTSVPEDAVAIDPAGKYHGPRYSGPDPESSAKPATRPANLWFAGCMQLK
jgi:hypothetical protein